MARMNRVRVNMAAVRRFGEEARKETKRQQDLIKFERELLQAEARQAGPFGNPNLTRRQQAEGGGGFTPVKGSVSEGAQALFEGRGQAGSMFGRRIAGATGDRKEAARLLDKQVGRITSRIGKKRGGTLGFEGRRSPSVLNTGSGESPKGKKTKLGV